MPADTDALLARDALLAELAACGFDQSDRMAIWGIVSEWREGADAARDATGLGRLAQAVYRRPLRARDWDGGSNARILHAAAGKIESLESIIRRLTGELPPLPEAEAGDGDDGA